jgi:hypothetical protein
LETERRFYLEKKVTAVVKHGVRSEQEVVCIVCFDVSKQDALSLEGVEQAFSAKIFIPRKNQYGSNVSIRMIGHAEDLDIDTTIAQEALFTYVKTYKAYHP